MCGIAGMFGPGARREAVAAMVEHLVHRGPDARWVVGRTGFIIGPLRNAGVMTIPELFEKRFNVRVRWLAGLFVVMGGLLGWIMLSVLGPVYDVISKIKA